MTDIPEREANRHGCVMALVGFTIGVILANVIYLIVRELKHYNGG